MHNRTEMVSKQLMAFSTASYEVIDFQQLSDSLRLDASYFLGTANAILVAAAEKQFDLLGDLAEVFTVYIQSPILSFVKEAGFSRPYLSPSETFEFRLDHSRWASLLADPRLVEWKVRFNTILVTRSGTIGQICFVDSLLDGSLISGDAIRVIIDEEPERNYVYTILKNQFALAHLSTGTYGSVVGHISVDQLMKFPIPKVKSEFKDRISQKIVQSQTSVIEHRTLLMEADALILKSNGLPKLCEKDAEWFDQERKIESSLVSSRGIVRNNHSGSEYRLDAHFYNPLAQLAIENISQAKTEVETIDDVTERVFLVPRFKRNYVDKKYGPPFLSGKNIIQTRPTDLKYLSKSETKNLELYYLEKKWTLITCSGTIGRTCFVWENYENYTATQHILRVVPDDTQVDPGYLYAFLSSQYGKLQVLRYSHGSVIDEITNKQIKKVLIPLPSEDEQKQIGDLVRSAYEKRAEAIRLEDEAQEILMEALTQ